MPSRRPPTHPTTANYCVTDLLKFLAGRWHLARTIAGPGGAPLGVAHGTAEWRDAGCGAGASAYDERGILVQHGAELPFTQSYTYTRSGAEPHRAAVAFRDGRFFHALDLSAGACAVRHECAPDLYEGTVTAVSPAALRFEWRVTGPFKSYTIRTDLTRE